MKLAYSPASPYVRKVTACAIKRGIDKQIERMKISTTDPELLKYNALSKVPTLITDDGAYLFDSPVICEYLEDAHPTAVRLRPESAYDRAQMRVWTKWVDEYFCWCVSTIGWERRRSSGYLLD